MNNYGIDQLIVDARGAHIVWDSLEEFEKLAPQIIKKYNKSTCEAVLRGDGHEGYGGFNSATKAMAAIKAGWPEMLAKLQSMWGDTRPQLMLANSKVTARRRKRIRSDHGDTLDMHRVWGGQLDKAWERPQRIQRLTSSQRHATIYVDVFTTCYTDAASVLWRAAAATLICDILISAGRAVEIYVGASCQNAFDYGAPAMFWNAMRVKSYSAPLNAERLAAMTTATFFRTYGFQMVCAMPFKANSSMGYAMHSGLPAQLQKRKDDGELVVRISHCTNMQQAEAEFMKVSKMLADEQMAEVAA